MHDAASSWNGGFIRQVCNRRVLLPDKSGVPVAVSRCDRPEAYATILFCAWRATRYSSFMLWAYTKYHALGNDYIVIDPKNLPSPLTTAQVKTICHRNFGIGSDGILLGPLPSKKAKFALRIFNPDGSEAEKSGNGLRIFSRYLWDKKRVRQNAFTLETPGGLVQAEVMDQEIGRAARRGRG